MCYSNFKMKLTWLLLVALFCVTLSSAQQTAIGTVVNVRAQTPTVCSATDSGLKCNSCTTALVCSGGSSLATVTCSSQNSFCNPDTNSCTSVQPSTCGSSFRCPVEGYFPDPDNCDSYYFCTNALTAVRYQCPANYVFDKSINRCAIKYFIWDCVTMKCTKADEFITYSKDTSIYGWCDASKSLHMFKCPTSLVFDKISMGCKFVCTQKGYYPGATSADAYFCYLDGYTYRYVTLNCPTGYEFNASFTCVTSTTTSTVATTQATTPSTSAASTESTPAPTTESTSAASTESTPEPTLPIS